MTSPLLSLEEVAVDYSLGEDATLHALTNVSLAIGAGEIVGVVGESGCGKSTLATTILRLLPPNASVEHGSIRFDGRDLLALDERALGRVRGAEIAMVFQDPLSSLNPSRTVGRHLLDVQRAHAGRGRTSRSSMMQRAEEVLAEVGIPDSRERLDDYPHQFSGGMRQRIMIAMALSLQPALIIADEPTSALDVTLAAQVLELLKRLRREHGTSILLISHDLGVIAQTCDRVVVMYAGEIVEEGAVADVFLAPRHPYTRALLDATPTRARRGHRLETIPGSVPGLTSLPASCRFADRCRYAFSECRLQHPDLLAAGPVRVRCLLYADGAGADSPLVASADAAAPPSTAAAAPASDDGAPTAESLVVLDKVDVRFGSHSMPLLRLGRTRRGAVRAVDDVTLEIRTGEILGLVGESGSGKTTLARAMLGLTPPSGGQVRFAGKRVDRLRPRELRQFRRQAQMIFQEPVSGLSPRLKVGYLLDEPYRIHPVPREQRYSQDELLAMVGLEHAHLSKYPHELSGGQARRVGIARALALRPRFLVADEPTASLDLSVGGSVLNLMAQLVAEFDLTFLIITHNLATVGYIADRVAVMYLGSIVEIGPTDRVFRSPAHPYTRALLAAIPDADPRQRRTTRLLLPGEIPSPRDVPSGCRFHTRCPFARDRCRTEAPVLDTVELGHQAACHYWPEIRSAAPGDMPELVPATRPDLKGQAE